VDQAARVRLQIRVVLVVFRGEMTRMDRWNLSAADRKDFTDALRSRSFRILDSARESLNGSAPQHPDLVREIDEARGEVSAGS
jgi:hypothetical protein